VVGGGVGGGVRPDERALKQRTRWTGVWDADSAGVENAALENAGLENVDKTYGNR